MKEFLQKHWINALGIGFLFMALLYFLKLAVASGWFPIELRLALSTLLGFSGLFFGFKQIKQNKATLGQVIAGLGTAILYATVGYISFSNELQWSSGSLLIAMVGISVTVSGVAVRQDQRILFALSVLGGLIAPFIIRAAATLDFQLFIYLLVINVAAIYASLVKGWKENMLIGFLLSICLFASYYFLFSPGNWERPFMYSTVLFVLFLIGFTVSSFRSEGKFDGIELLLGLANGINYIFWSYYILEEFTLSYTIPFAITGVLFLVLACLVYYRSKKNAVVAFGTYLAVSLMALGIVGNDLSALYQNGGINYVIVAGVWMLLTSIIFYVGRKLKDRSMSMFSMVTFIGLVIYWFAKAWSVDWFPIFGIKYIPFLNLGAFVWIGLIVLGFLFAIDLRRSNSQLIKSDKADDSALMALLSHILIGGLLTVQIMNLWDAYDMSNVNQDLTLSLMWFIYALVIFLWNKYAQHILFNMMGVVVLVVSTLKVIFWDLDAQSSIQKIVFLVVLGGITLLIGKLQVKKRSIEEQVAKPED